MIPSDNQLKESKMMCNTLKLCGFSVSFSLCVSPHCSAIKYPKILVMKGDKLYHFSDPDWNVVNRQLQSLLQNVMVSS